MSDTGFDNLSKLLDDDPPAAEKTTKPKVKSAKRDDGEIDKSDRVWIMLEHNEDIPPGGQFVSVNGEAFLLQPGHEVHVPRAVMEVLDHAIMSVPYTDAMHTVIGYRDRLRLPYRVINKK